MFSKLRRSKSEKPVEPPKLRGMPALKQKRSSKRFDNLSSTPLGPKLTEFERLRISVDETESSGFNGPVSNSEPALRHENASANITRNYKRPMSANLEQRDRPYSLADHSNNVDRLKSAGQLLHEDKMKGTVEDIAEEDEDKEEVDSLATPWRISKGDSGYKSKDEEAMKDEKKKAKRSRKKGSGAKQRGKGLHTIKQQRKASREEYVSQSMRALTPKERESIQCLEEVLKNHSDGEDSDEVFDSDSSNNDIEEIEEEDSEKSKLDENVDYGYASINDNHRKYSLESISSVGSIIDLVGNLPETSSPKSPAYASVEFDDVTEDRQFDDVTTDTVSGRGNKCASDHYSDATLQCDDTTIRPEDAITHLDDVIHSFINLSDVTSDEDENERMKGKNNDTDQRTADSFTVVNGLETERTHKDTKKSGSEKERKKKMRKKSDKRVDYSSERLTPAQKESIKKQYGPDENHNEKANPIATEEPIYAQVKKTKKKNKDRSTETNHTENVKRANQGLLDPPSQFGNHVQEVETVAKVEIPNFGNEKKQPKESSEPMGRSSRLFWERLNEKQTQHETNLRSRDRVVSSSLVTSQASSHTSVHMESGDHRHPTPAPVSSRPVSDGSDYRPQMSKFPPDLSSRIRISQSMLHDSSRGLRHIDVRASKGKVLRVDPDHNKIVEGIAQENLVQKERIFDRRELHSNNHTAKNAAGETSTKNERGYERRVHADQHTAPPVTAVDINRNPVKLRNKPQAAKKPPGRPISLNLDQSGNLKLPVNEKPSVVIRPYSSFRQDRVNPKETSNVKPRPFVITPLKKPIQLY